MNISLVFLVILSWHFSIAACPLCKQRDPIIRLQAVSIDSITPFVDALPIPAVLRPVGTYRGMPLYRYTFSQFQQKMHRDLPPTTTWGMNGVFPGPVLKTKHNQAVAVEYVNNLPTQHLFAAEVASMISLMPVLATMPTVRTITHLHGGITAQWADGYPELWTTPGNSIILQYENQGRPFFTFLHDHAIGITQFNVTAGLVAPYIIEEENNFNLPSGAYDIPLVITPKTVNPDGSLVYNRCGILSIVNGMILPYLAVEPRKYRFRIINGAGTWLLNLALSNGMPFTIIADDGGLLEAPVNTTNIFMSPSERYEVIVDFSGHNGELITMTNDTICLSDTTPYTLPEIMQFQVTLPLKKPDTSSIPSSFTPYVPSKAELLANISVERNITLDGQFGQNFLYLMDNLRFQAPVTNVIKKNAVELWNIVNLSDDSHPFHNHLVKFFVLGTTPIDVEAYKRDRDAGKLQPIQYYFTGPTQPPAAYASGLKDTYLVPVGTVTQIVNQFKDYTGLFVYHCHYLDHEDYDMMRPYKVID